MRLAGTSACRLLDGACRDRCCSLAADWLSSSPLQDYLAHIIDQCDLLMAPEQVCALFGNIEDIYEFNR